MKKLAFILSMMLIMGTTSCGILTNQNGTGIFGNKYETNTPPPPPTNNNTYHNGNNNHYQYNGHNQSSQHVTQNTGSNKPGQHVTQTHNGNNYNTNGYNNNGTITHRPQIGTVVNSLPNKNIRTATVNGETLYIIDGVYYKSVRTTNGNGYKIVGYQN